MATATKLTDEMMRQFREDVLNGVGRMRLREKYNLGTATVRRMQIGVLNSVGSTVTQKTLRQVDAEASEIEAQAATPQGLTNNPK